MKTAFEIFRKHWKNHKADKELLLSTADQNMIEEAMEEYASQFKSDMFNLSEIEPLLNALKVIKNWDDETEDEWEDPGYVADHALKNWNVK